MDATAESQDKAHSHVEVSDISVEDYINAISKHPLYKLYKPHTAGMYTAPVRRHQTRPLKPFKFRKVEDYINATSKHPSFMPHTAGRYQARWISKGPTNSLRRNNGKKLTPCH